MIRSSTRTAEEKRKTLEDGRAKAKATKAERKAAQKRKDSMRVRHRTHRSQYANALEPVLLYSQVTELAISNKKVNYKGAPPRTQCMLPHRSYPTAATNTTINAHTQVKVDDWESSRPSKARTTGAGTSSTNFGRSGCA